jgi:hypothetical protein
MSVARMVSAGLGSCGPFGSWRGRTRRTFVYVLALIGVGAAMFVAPPVGADSPPQQGAPTGLNVEDRTAPLDITGSPQFGWLPQTPAGVSGDSQTAYEIQVNYGPGNGANTGNQVWDSGKVGSSAESYVAYSGPTLAHGTSYTWTVRTWDSSGTASPYAPLATFDTGINDNEWSGAQWIRRVTTGNDLKDDYSLYLKDITLNDPSSTVVRARVYIGAIAGLWELHANGQVIDTQYDYGAPGENYYDVEDITPQAQAAESGSSTLPIGVKYANWATTAAGPRPTGPIAVSTTTNAPGNAGDTSLTTGAVAEYAAGEVLGVGTAGSSSFETDTLTSVTTTDTLSISGSPTGGTFTLTDPSWGTTAPIAYNASAASVAAALNALSGSGGSAFSATGGGLPGTPIVITVNGANHILTTTGSFTGGSSPKAANAAMDTLAFNAGLTQAHASGTTVVSENGPSGLLAKVVIDYADGSSQTVVTDPSWLVTKDTEANTTTTPALRSGQNSGYYVELTNANQELTGWDQPGYSLTAAWVPATSMGVAPLVEPASCADYASGGSPCGLTHLNPQQSSLSYHIVHPVSVTTLEDGTVEADFGTSIVGIPVVQLNNGVSGNVVNLYGSYRLDHSTLVTPTAAGATSINVAIPSSSAGGFKVTVGDPITVDAPADGYGAGNPETDTVTSVTPVSSTIETLGLSTPLTLPHGSSATFDTNQTLTVTGTPTGGTFTLTDPVWGTTTPIAYNATSAQVAAALNALPGSGGNAFAVSGGALPGTAVVITLQNSALTTGTPAGNHVLTITNSALTGGTSPTVNDVTPVWVQGSRIGSPTAKDLDNQDVNLNFNYTEANGAQTTDFYVPVGFRYLEIDNPGETLNASQIWAVATSENAPVSDSVYSIAPPDESQTVSITGDPTGGTFTLTDPTWGTTAPIAYNATSAQVAAALNALSGSGGNAFVGQSEPGTPIVITLQNGALSGNHLLTVTNSALTGVTGGVSPTVTIVGPTVQHESTFTSSNPTLNNVFQLLERTALYGGQEEYNDSPDRQDGQFLGDTVNQSFATTEGLDERTLTRQAIQDMIDSQNRFWLTGVLACSTATGPCVHNPVIPGPSTSGSSSLGAPGGQYGDMNAIYPDDVGARDIPDYTEMFPEWVMHYYQMTGDLSTLQSAYPAMQAVNQYVTDAIPTSGPFQGLVYNLAGGGSASGTQPNLTESLSSSYGHGILDWPAPMRYSMPWLGTHTGGASEAIIDDRGVSVFSSDAQAATILGDTADAATYTTQANNLTSAINNDMIENAANCAAPSSCTATGRYDDGVEATSSAATSTQLTGVAEQHAQAFAVTYGVAPASSYPALGNYIASQGMQAGPMDWAQLETALIKTNQSNALVNLLTNQNQDGPAKSLAEGGTSMWELWDPGCSTAPCYGSSVSQTATDSFSHGWGSAGVYPILRGLLGLTVTGAGASAIQIQPPGGNPLGGGLSSAGGTEWTERGQVGINWLVDNNGNYTLTTSVPDNIAATVKIPDPNDISYTATAGANGVQAQGISGGFATFTMGSSDSTTFSASPLATTAQLSPSPANGYYTTDPTVTLNATDVGGPGVASTMYQIDGGGWKTYNGPFQITGDGNHTLQYYSTDNIGSAENTNTMTVSVDTTLPVSAISFSPSPVNGATSGPATVTISATDNLSGVASTMYQIDGGAWQTYNGPFQITAPGPHTIMYYSTDAAGNVESPKSASIAAYSAQTAPTNVTGNVPGTLGVSVVGSSAPSLGTFVPGSAQTYTTTLNTTVTSSGGNATLTAIDASAPPTTSLTGYLVNNAAGGPYALRSPLKISATDGGTSPSSGNQVLTSGTPVALLSYGAPVSNDPVAIGFAQPIGATEPLRTGTYSIAVTLTLSTTAP